MSDASPPSPDRPWTSRATPCLLAILGLVGLGAGCGPSSANEKKVLVLGIDGMDPDFFREHADRLPNFAALARDGDFQDLGTVMPPQSPVAWSTVITGMEPSGHGVFDFVHRHPDDVSAFSSMAETTPPDWLLEVGEFSLPLKGGGTRPLRKGKAFWEVLDEHGVDAVMTKMPTDFPPLEAATQAISGMGTPDMLGSFGTFQYFSGDPLEVTSATVSGGELHRVELIDGEATAKLLGPVNTFYKDAPRTSVPLEVELDPEHPTAKIRLGGETLVLQEGDWSDWVRVEFELVPWMMSTTGIVRLFLKEVRPHFKLYVSPVNIDPAAPELPISEPPEYAAELAEAVGPFYTQGMAEETKGLSAGVLTREQFVTQAHLVLDESIELYEHQLEQFDSGLLFYYFSTIDQAGHMLYGKYDEQYLTFYERVDEVLGETRKTIDEDTVLMVISDHGFERFDREVNLNTWLMDEGYLVLDDPSNVSQEPGFPHVDWSKTRAYAMGLNGLYINTKGREARGIVEPADVEALKGEIEGKLLAFTDPEEGAKVVSRVYDPSEHYEQGDEREYSPDLLVGFAPPYRMSPDSGLGAVPAKAVEDNEDEWIGDHCMAHDAVSGVLFTNQAISSEAPRLHDIPVTILDEFGISAPASMVGQDVVSAP